MLNFASHGKKISPWQLQFSLPVHLIQMWRNTTVATRFIDKDITRFFITVLNSPDYHLLSLKKLSWHLVSLLKISNESKKRKSTSTDNVIAVQTFVFYTQRCVAISCLQFKCKRLCVCIVVLPYVFKWKLPVGEFSHQIEGTQDCGCLTSHGVAHEWG